MIVRKFIVLGTFAALALGVQMTQSAQAAFIATAQEVDGNVVVTGSGSLKLTDLTFLSSQENASDIDPQQGTVAVGPIFGNVSDYFSISGPSSFGPGNQHENPSTGTGSFVSVVNFDGLLVVPEGYVSGQFLTGTATYDDATFSSLGFTPGTYVWTWGSGANADSFTFDIELPTSVPEPATVVLLGCSLLGLGLVRRRKS